VKAITTAVVALILAVSGAALAQDRTIDLRLSHWVPPTHPLHPSLQAWAESIAKESNGTIKSTLFPAEQLGKAFDHYDMARDGIADFTYVNPGYQPGRFPIIAAGELPFLIANAKGGSAAFDEWYRKYAEREMKDVKVCFAYLHDPGTFHGNKKIRLPEEVRGLKVRPANATIGQLVTLLGGTNVQASAPEARDMLERGIADEITFPWRSIVLFGIDKTVKFHMDANLYVTTFVWAMNKARYDSMSATQKRVIDAHCTTEWARKVADPWADFEASGRDMIRAMAGHETYALTSAELDAWRKAAAPLQERWATAVRQIGLNPDSVLDELKASLTKHNSAGM
jgi:TRAP-type transport system periplasmic protein